MATTYITKARRQDLIEQYIDCFMDTHSYSTEEAAEQEAAEWRQALESMNNSQLIAEFHANGWSFV